MKRKPGTVSAEDHAAALLLVRRCTLRDVAKEMRESAKNLRKQAACLARRRAYGGAHDDETWSQALDCWARHFEGQAERET